MTDIRTIFKSVTKPRLSRISDQWCIWKLDLHYSHKDPVFRAFCDKNRIAILYVPAGCTEIRQECDTVLNKTYKCGVKAGFRDYLYRLFNAHLRATNDATTFYPKLTLGELKPHIVEFVETGMEACRTPEFKLSIIKAFKEDGCFEEMRGPARQATARAELEAELLIAQQQLAVEPEGGEGGDINLEDLRMFDLEHYIPDGIEIEAHNEFVLDGLAQEVNQLMIGTEEDEIEWPADEDDHDSDDGFGDLV